MRVRIAVSAGFTLVEIMIVVAIIGLLAAVAVPNFVKTRTTAQQKACIKNLNTLEAAKQMWGVELGKTDGVMPTESDLIGPTLYIKQMPTCPSGGNYTLNAIGQAATCTIAGHTL